MMLVGDLVKWILSNRRGRAFNGWSEEKIAIVVCKSIETGSLIYAVDDYKNFTGVFIFVKDVDTETAETGPLLTIKPGVLKQMAKHFYKEYPDWTLLAHSKKGGFVKDGNKFLRKLIKRKI